MAAVTFDTHKFIRTLEAAGLPTPQAEAISSAVQESHNSADVATSADIAAVRADLRELAQATKADLREVEIRLTGEIGLLKWMLGVTVAGVVTILIKLFI
ncbi:MAG: hypothetical protein VB131_01170, partial [Burkholderia gladioli]